MPPHNAGLAFRLRPTARYLRLPQGKPVLVLGYPLRAMFVHSTWHPALACLQDGPWVPLERIAAALPQIPSRQIELFFNGLVRKGYVTRQGYPILKKTAYPPVSVIVPVRNRPEDIQACLDSLTVLDYPAEKLEIIVVDDASEDNTAEVVEQYPDVRLLRMTRQRQASFCRNRAAEIARGEILAFIDSDCLADPAWLKQLVPAFLDPSLGALGGLVDAAWEEKGLDRYEKVKSSLKMGSLFKRSDQGERFFYVPTCNFLVRKAVFTDLGGFRETLYVGEDVDLCWRLQDAGHAMEYRPLGRVAHKHRNYLLPFCARRFDYGTSEPVLQELHIGRVKTLFLPWTESLFWLTVLLALPLNALWPLIPGVILFLMDGIKRHAKLRIRQIPVPRHQVYIAIFRGYLSFIHNCCGFISRYYLVVLPLVLPVSPLLGAIALGMHLIAGTVEFFLKKPRLSLPAFLIFFTLEQISYQAGVWWQCLRQMNFRPVLPHIVHKRI